ncbi:MAG TPA: FCD domain-containing protein [Alphaproteobacteria bacterium]|nr:FCD domain-containing protein [Alphaproteobacteria bacterium]
MEHDQERSDDLTIVRTVSLTSALERELERLILSGELPPGHRINEIQLANRFGTSRGPIREATRSLEARGLVEMVRNRGVFIRRLSVQEALEIYDIRAALFGLAGRLLAERMDDKILASLNRQLQAMDKAADAGDFEAYYPLNLGFHDFIVRTAGNDTLASEYKSFVKKMHLFRARSLVQGGGLAVSNREHRAIVDALAAGNVERSQEAAWRHVECAKHRLLAAVEALPNP